MRGIAEFERLALAVTLRLFGLATGNRPVVHSWQRSCDGRWRSVAVISLLLSSGGSAIAQTDTPLQFEVASIKRARPDAVWGFHFAPGGRATLTDFSMNELIILAWHTQGFRIVGGPSWFDSERYTIEAEAEGNPVLEDSRLMLRSLLQDRFRLALHRETRELPAYALVPVKSGARLAEAKNGSCKTADESSGPTPPSEPGLPGCGFSQRLRPQNNGAPMMQLQGHSVTTSMIARMIGNILDRAVSDDTGISGSFDISVEYAMDDGLLKRVAPDARVSDNTAPSLFTALQEQVGLKLESRRVPVEVLVIDHAERPSAN
jgi:uncharacterized protein (TIGR03435 family)